MTRAREETEDERFERIDLLLSKIECFFAGMTFGVLVIALMAVLS